MRTLVLILMVALLPLRLWAAEGMSVRMAQEQVAAASDASQADRMPADCPMMAKAAADNGSGDEAPQVAGHCVACHLCAASACLPDVAFDHARALAAPPLWSATGYASAEPEQALRPPIS